MSSVAHKSNGVVVKMILTGKEIRRQVENGNIRIDPFDERQVNPNSYNYRLGDYYTQVPELLSLGQSREAENLKEISEEGLQLEPGIIYLSSTYETIGSSKYVTLLIGRSSVARLGLFLQISADLGNLGPAHKWTLELTCVQPIIIYPRMKIGQVSFWVPEGEIEEYSGTYTNYDGPKHSIYDLLLKE
jgi:dCTP deaminase